jgi:hypothetical protein
VYVIAWDEVYGTSIEFIARYRDSELIYSGHGVYRSTEYGTKVYIRWTADNAENVKKHYDHFPDSWRAWVIPVAEVGYRGLVVCTITFSSTNACETVMNNLPDYGTLIVFTHDYFAG